MQRGIKEKNRYGKTGQKKEKTTNDMTPMKNGGLR